MRKMLTVAFAVYAFVPCLAAAATKATPTPAPTPQAACYQMQDCVDQAVSPIASACRAGVECNRDNDKFVITAGELAQRAIDHWKCDTKVFKTRGLCIRCYNKAKSAVRDRMGAFLFRGFMSFANWNIENSKDTRCNAMFPATPTPTP